MCIRDRQGAPLLRGHCHKRLAAGPPGVWVVAELSIEGLMSEVWQSTAWSLDVIGGAGEEAVDVLALVGKRPRMLARELRAGAVAAPGGQGVHLLHHLRVASAGDVRAGLDVAG